MANEDRRGDTLRQHPVYRYEFGTIAMATGGTVEVTRSATLNGIIGTIVLVLPASSATGKTATLKVYDEDDYTLYTASGKAESTTHVLTACDILCAGTISIGLQASGDPTATWTGTIVLYVV